MSEFAVFRGFLDPEDREQKSDRRCVVLGMLDGGRVLLAPVTSYPARKGLVVPPGSVLLTKESPAYKGSGFTVDAVAINIKDVLMTNLDSRWCKNLERVGTLRILRDKRLADNLIGLMRQYGLKPRTA